MMKCEECGAQSTGTWSEGGAKWALCPDCYERRMCGERDRPVAEGSGYVRK